MQKSFSEKNGFLGLFGTFSDDWRNAAYDDEIPVNMAFAQEGLFPDIHKTPQSDTECLFESPLYDCGCRYKTVIVLRGDDGYEYRAVYTEENFVEDDVNPEPSDSKATTSPSTSEPDVPLTQPPSSVPTSTPNSPDSSTSTSPSQSPSSTPGPNQRHAETSSVNSKIALKDKNINNQYSSKTIEAGKLPNPPLLANNEGEVNNNERYFYVFKSKKQGEAEEISYKYFTTTYEDIMNRQIIDSNNNKTIKIDIAGYEQVIIDTDNSPGKCGKFRKEFSKIMNKVQREGYETYVPYIENVKNHWYRDVYFIAKSDSIQEKGFVTYDLEYESLMNERWTLYETYINKKKEEETDINLQYKCQPEKAGDFILYVIDNDGNYLKGQNINDEAHLSQKVPQDKIKAINNSDPDTLYIYNGTQEEANKEGVPVAKKAITNKLESAEDAEKYNWNVNSDKKIYSAYDFNVNNTTERQKAVFTEKDKTEGEFKDFSFKDEIMDNISADITVGKIVQTGDGLRTETNPEIKKMFLVNKYFRYDGSEDTARIITALRYKISNVTPNTKEDERNLKFGNLNDLDENAIFATKEDFPENVKLNNKKDKYYLKDYVGTVSMQQDSLNAFSMLENTHTLDADYIYKDFKELVVELGYFTKEELTDETPKILQFPVANISSNNFPDRSLDKRENELCTMIHSNYDIVANKKYTLAEILGESESEDDGDEEPYQDQAEANITDELKNSNEKYANINEDSFMISGKERSLLSGSAENLKGTTLIETAVNCWNYIRDKSKDGELFQKHDGTTIPPYNSTTIDCSSFISWVLYEYGFTEFEGQQLTTDDLFNRNWNESYGWEEIDVNAGQNIFDLIQPGDIFVKFNGLPPKDPNYVGHVTFVVEVLKEDQKILCCDCGGEEYWLERKVI